ncbi:MAG: rhodanese-like domain-containing protein, partial [Flavobacteriales bacterium CG_4_10_14_0_2_um_filter_35_18]
MKHLKLFLAILFFVSLGSVSIAQSDSGVIKLIEPNDLLNTLKSSKIQLVDVRTPSEFATGHIGKSVNIDYYDQDFSAKIGKLDKSKPIYLYC